MWLLQMLSTDQLYFLLRNIEQAFRDSDERRRRRRLCSSHRRSTFLGEEELSQVNRWKIGDVSKLQKCCLLI
jgi:hypothetical protein